jgi:hypothetical protein
MDIPTKIPFHTHDVEPLAWLCQMTRKCRYCYEVHGNWWLMDAADYSGRAGVVLCGICEHTEHDEAVESWLALQAGGGSDA